MNYYVWQRTCVDANGTVLPSATVTVTDAVSGALATLYSDAGVTGTGNPITADSNGFARFYVKAGKYTIVAASGLSTRTWTAEDIGGPYPRTAAEVTAGVTPTDYGIPSHLDLGGIVLPERYGFVYDYSSHNTARDNALLVAEQIQGRIGLNGAMYFSTDLVLPRNVGFIGMGPNYGGQLVPTGSARIKLYGSLVTGGWVFRNAFESLCIDSSQTSAPNTIDIDHAYNVVFRDVLISGQGTNGANVRAVKIVTSNDIVLDRVQFKGYSPTFTGQYGVEIGNDVSATLIACDIESVNRCIYLNGNCNVQLFGGYFERYSAHCIYASLTAGGSLDVYSGRYLNVNSGSVAVFIDNGSANVNLHNLEITLNGGTGIYAYAGSFSNVNVYGFRPGDINDAHNAIRRYGGTNVSDTYENVLYNKKTQTDNTSTDHYKVTLASGAVVSCELTAFAMLGGYAKVHQTRKFLVTYAGGAAQVSTLQTVGTDVGESSSANFGITMTLTVGLSTNVATISVTADTTGAIGNGQSCDVFTRLTVIGTTSPSSYVDTL